MAERKNVTLPILSEMTTEQKLGMLFCARRFASADCDDVKFTLELIKNRALGCVQLSPGKDEINRTIIEAADYPLLVINDTETGYPISEKPRVSPMSLAACGERRYYEAFARGIVEDAKKNGFNGTWGPVIDILRCDGPARVHRHYGDDPDSVARGAEMIAKVFRDNGFLSCGKHYPGGHDCPFDTHMTEGISEVTEEELIAFDLKPYTYLLERGLLPSIMTSHTVYGKIDPDYPASLSKKVIDIIRRLGFDGVCFTDSFAMMGILQKYGEENIYGMAVAAGNDIILPNYRTPTRDAFGMLAQNYRDGAFDEERLDEAVRRVLSAMEFVNAPPTAPTVFSDDDGRALRDIARDCITAVTDDNTSAALDKYEDNGKRLFVILTDNGFDPKSPEQEISTSRWYYPNTLAEKIRAEFPGAKIEFIPEFASGGDNDRVLNAATKCDGVVFCTFCTTAAYLGTDCLTRRTESLINCMAHSGKVEAVVHFGNPYAVKPLIHVPRLIFGYSMTASLGHAIEVLSGRVIPKGHLPYNCGI